MNFLRKLGIAYMSMFDYKAPFMVGLGAVVLSALGVVGLIGLTVFCYAVFPPLGFLLTLTIIGIPTFLLFSYCWPEEE